MNDHNFMVLKKKKNGFITQNTINFTYQQWNTYVYIYTYICFTVYVIL